ncbi:MAG: hypothetical protein V1885_02945 [Candidatus Brennerbacteria bacterium]
MEGSSFKPQIGTGEGESPLAPRPVTPPSPSLETRTFSSDLGSIRSTGGSEPAPYTPSPVKPIVPPPGIAVSGTFPRVGGAPPVPPVGGMPPSLSIPSSPIIPPATPKTGGKKIFVAVLSFLIVVALGAIGYFFVYPLFMGEVPAVTPPPAAPVLPEPENSGTSGIHPFEESATSTGEAPETPVVDPWSGIQGVSSHDSLFTTRADTVTEVILTAPTLQAFKSALPSGSVATPLMSEVVVKMPSGNILPFSKLATLIAPTFFTSSLLSSFDEDATYFTYAEPSGTWFGMVVQLRAGAPIGPVQDGMGTLQANPDLANFFLEDPGEKGVWVDGSVREKPASQVSFEAPGATFSYTWFGRNLLLSTNLTGAEAAAELLGF